MANEPNFKRRGKEVKYVFCFERRIVLRLQCTKTTMDIYGLAYKDIRLVEITFYLNFWYGISCLYTTSIFKSALCKLRQGWHPEWEHKNVARIFYWIVFYAGIHVITELIESITWNQSNKMWSGMTHFKFWPIGPWEITLRTQVNTLRPRQNGRRFADDTFKRIFLNENVRISIKISLKFVPKGPINNNPALVQIMAWRRPGDKPLSEPMMVSLPTHICVTRP